MRGEVGNKLTIAASHRDYQYPSINLNIMFRAIGIVIILIALRLLMPELFHGIQHLMLTFFQTTERMFSYAPTDVLQMSGAAYIPAAAPLPMVF